MSDAVLGQIMANIANEGVLAGKTNRSFPNQNNVIAFAPALIATKDDIDRIVSAVRIGLENSCKK